MPDMNDVQAELMDMITKNESPSEISDKIKDMLFSKSAERVDAFKPDVANSLFNDDQPEEEDEVEVEAETDTEVEAEADTEVEDETAEPTAKLF